MALFCIPKKLARDLKTDFLVGKNIAELYTMSNAQRQEFFTKSTNPELGKFLANKFKQAMAKKNKEGLTDFIKSIAEPKVKDGIELKGVYKKIQTLTEDGAFDTNANKAILRDVISERLGLIATEEEMLFMKTLSDKITTVHKQAGKKLGGILAYDETVDFWVHHRIMEDFLEGQIPTSDLRILTGIIGRGTMLTSIKSPILNIGSNIEVGLSEAVARRIETLQAFGFKESKIKIKRRVFDGFAKNKDGEKVPKFKDAEEIEQTPSQAYKSLARDVYRTSGYDITRMLTIHDNTTSGGRVLDDVVHLHGDTDKTGVAGKLSRVNRKLGKFFVDKVFTGIMGRPDSEFAILAFNDSASLHSKKAAKKLLGKGASNDAVNKLAQELMIEAQAINQNPDNVLTEREAIIAFIRNSAILDAQVATWTQDSWNSVLALKFRKLLNDVTGDVRAGDLLVPFVKTPSNVLAYGLDTAGIAALRMGKNTIVAYKQGKLKDPIYLRKMARDATRMGLGLTLSFLVAMQLDDDDFMGAYDPDRHQFTQLQNGNYNAIRLGKYWVSTDWLGPIAIPVTAIMYARKYGKGKFSDRATQYGVGVASQFLQTPGIEQFVDLSKDAIAINKTNPAKLTQGVMETVSNFIVSRTVPSLVFDVAKAAKIQVSPEFGKNVPIIGSGINTVSAKLRDKRNVFGEKINDEPWWIDLFFGSRVKSGKDSPVLREMTQVMTDSGKTITFTDWTKENTKALKQFKERVGKQDYNKAVLEYGDELKKQLDKLINSDDYKKGNTEEKLEFIRDADTNAQNEIFDRYNFDYKQDRKKSKKVKRTLR